MTLRIKKPVKKNRPRIWIARLFLLAGVAGIGAWAWSVGFTAVSQDWENWVFDRELQGKQPFVDEYVQERAERIGGPAKTWLGYPETPKLATSTPPAVPSLRLPAPRSSTVEINSLVGRLTIPRLHLSATVREGAEENTLRGALGHIPHTAMPGQAGNVGVAGHRDTLFRGLRDIQKNDVIVLETLSGRYVYKTDSLEIVSPKKVSVLRAGEYPELTLVTCYPFSYVGPAPQRFIVKARQITGASMEQPAFAATSHDAPELPADQQPLSPDTTGVPHKHPGRRVRFEVTKNHSQQLAQGVSIGLTGTDVNDRRVNGWMWLMPDRRTIWLRDQHLQAPVTFYGREDGRKRELVITDVTQSSASGYLLLPDAQVSASE